MFELGRKPSQVILVLFLHRKEQKSQKIAKAFRCSVGTPLERVYPQSDVSLTIVDIDASERFVDLWVHLSFAIFAIFEHKRHRKLLERACDQVQTCLIFPLRWAGFPIKISRNALWEDLFSMYFDVFFIIYIIF